MSRRVLAIRPSGRGFGYAVLEDAKRLLDWGVRGGKVADVDRSMNKIRRLIRISDPETLVIEDLSGSKSRSPRAHELIEKVGKVAAELSLKTRSISLRTAKRALDRSATHMKQYRLARLVAARFPVELNPRTPQPRKPWMSQDSRYWMFEAVALGLAAFRVAKPTSSKSTVEGDETEPLLDDPS